MTKELFGQLLGWLVVTVGAWFLSLLIMGYGLGDIVPWHWTQETRFQHLGLQFVLIAVYAYIMLPRREK